MAADADHLFGPFRGASICSTCVNVAKEWLDAREPHLVRLELAWGGHADTRIELTGSQLSRLVDELVETRIFAGVDSLRTDQEILSCMVIAWGLLWVINQWLIPQAQGQETTVNYIGAEVQNGGTVGTVATC
ncbi:MAG: hypothetical protein ACLPVF_14350 [Acidimicrobiales bacterium]